MEVHPKCIILSRRLATRRELGATCLRWRKFTAGFHRVRPLLRKRIRVQSFAWRPHAACPKRLASPQGTRNCLERSFSGRRHMKVMQNLCLPPCNLRPQRTQTAATFKERYMSPFRWQKVAGGTSKSQPKHHVFPSDLKLLLAHGSQKIGARGPSCVRPGEIGSASEGSLVDPLPDLAREPKGSLPETNCLILGTCGKCS